MSFLPPSVQSGGLAGFPQIAYDRTAVLEWQANTPGIEMLCDFKPMPRRDCQSCRWLFRRLPAQLQLGDMEESPLAE